MEQPRLFPNESARPVSPLAGLAGEIYADILEWCQGKSFLIRLPAWLLLLYIGVRQFLDPAYWSVFNYLNLAIHEGGHLLFRSLGMLMGIAGGTILQLLAPTASMFMFLKQRDYFAIAFCIGWLSTNLYGVGLYMADAQRQALPLVTVGDTEHIIHDWNWLFFKFGLLRHCETCGWLVRQLGLLSMLAALGFGAWLMWRMFKASQVASGK